jgi:hypothetical protein
VHCFTVSDFLAFPVPMHSRVALGQRRSNAHRAMQQRYRLPF